MVLMSHVRLHCVKFFFRHWVADQQNDERIDRPTDVLTYSLTVWRTALLDSQENYPILFPYWFICQSAGWGSSWKSRETNPPGKLRKDFHINLLCLHEVLKMLCVLFCRRWSYSGKRKLEEKEKNGTCSCSRKESSTRKEKKEEENSSLKTCWRFDITTVWTFKSPSIFCPTGYK